MMIRDLIIAALDARDAKGWETYGRAMEEAIPPTGCWKMDAIEELLDCCQYLARQVYDNEKVIAKLMNDRDGSL